MALPLPPQVGGPSGGQVGGMQAPAALPGTLPYQQPAAPSIVQGIAQFMQQYQTQRERTKQQDLQSAENDLKLIQLGIPVNLEKTAQKMKRAGLNIDFDTETVPNPTQVTNTIPGDMSRGIPPAQVTTPGRPLQQNTAPPPSMGSRIVGALGFGTPQVNPNSPGMEALQRLVAQGRSQQDMLAKQQANQSQLQTLVGAAINGDPKATEMVTRFGLANSLPGDEWFRFGRLAGKSDEETAQTQMWVAMGGPTFRKELTELADKNKDRFGGKFDQSLQYYNDILSKGTSDLAPQRSFDEEMKAAELASKLMELHPTLTWNMANTAAELELGGNREASNKLREYIAAKFPTKGQVNWQKWTATQANEAARIGIAQAGLGVDQQRLQLEMQKFVQSAKQFQVEHELDVIKAARTALGEQFDQFSKILNSKESTQETKDTALKGLVDALQKLGTLQVKTGDGQTMSMGTKNLSVDRVRTWTHPFSGVLQMSIPDVLSSTKQAEPGFMANGLGGAGVAAQGAPLAIIQAIRQAIRPRWEMDRDEMQAYQQRLNRRLMEAAGQQ